MQQQKIFAGRAVYVDAAELIERFGDHAAAEAKQRAERSRDLGNLIHFCRWREAGRLVAALADDAVEGRLH